MAAPVAGLAAFGTADALVRAGVVRRLADECLKRIDWLRWAGFVVRVGYEGADAMPRAQLMNGWTLCVTVARYTDDARAEAAYRALAVTLLGVLQAHYADMAGHGLGLGEPS